MNTIQMLHTVQQIDIIALGYFIYFLNHQLVFVFEKRIVLDVENGDLWQ